jgi:Xaa-Pro aminopeptidase
VFQSFDASGSADAVAGRVKLLREQIAKLGIDAFLVPRADEHQGEYVSPAAERLRWLTGFSGSAGFAVVTRKSAALLVDGRYTLQARAQTDTSVFEILDLVGGDWVAWLGKQLSTGAKVGFDPWLHTVAAVEAMRESGKKYSFVFKAVGRNPLDAAWGRERPATAIARIELHPARLAGATAQDKVSAIQKQIAADDHDAAVLTLPDSICWLFNIRGGDVAHTPIVHAFAIVPVSGKPVLFVEPAKVTADVRKALATFVRLEKPDQLGAQLDALKAARRKVRLDPASASFWLARRLGKSIVRGSDPCILPKARKTAAEIEGARAAHLRDGAAVVRFLAWLDREAVKGGVDEIVAVTELEAFRAASQKLKEISFDTISGSGPNGAIVHYRVTTKTNRQLQPGELFLIDSGAQYQDGTTDITRTVVIGKPTEEMRQRFTLVLKGHIKLAMARFPAGTRGVQLDTLARHALWQAGLEFEHGTGHGIGSYLSVHEGPQSISKRGMAALEPGMIVSNEPGYYKEGAYGIRLENLMVVTAPTAIPGGDRDMMGFDILTLAPFDRRLVDTKLLDAAERAWLDAYHERVLRELGPEVPPEVRGWLEKATAKLR